MKVSKTEWISKIEQDLRGKEINTLYWKYKQDFIIDPFPHSDDITINPTPLIQNKNQNSWQIAAEFNVENEIETNSLMLRMLQSGLQQIHVKIQNNWNINTLFSGVSLEMIHTVFIIDDLKDLPSFLSNLKQFIVKEQIEIDALQLGFQWVGSVDYLNDFYNEVSSYFPYAKSLHFKSDMDDSFGALTSILSQVYSFIKKNKSEDKEVLSRIIKQMTIHLKVDNEILFEIAKIRAFKILWFSLLKNIGLETIDPSISIYSNGNKLTPDKNDNLILLSVQGMIGAISGVDSIVLSFVNQGGDELFYERIAMNIQHVMRMEAKMDVVQDPVAGSYHFELLTDKIVQEVWKDFTKS